MKLEPKPKPKPQPQPKPEPKPEPVHQQLVAAAAVKVVKVVLREGVAAASPAKAATLGGVSTGHA
jgi:protein TonB